MEDKNDGIDLCSCEGEFRHLIVRRGNPAQEGLSQDKAWMSRMLVERNHPGPRR